MANKYFTEKQLCDAIWGSRQTELTAGYDVSLWVRETEIAYGLRPDFISFGRDGDTPVVLIFEVKITADAYSVAQVANYMWVMDRHATAWRTQYQGKIGHTACPRIEAFLVARHFDKSVYSAADLAGISLSRLAFTDHQFSVEYEEHLYVGSSFDPAGVKLLNKAFGKPSARTEAADGANPVH